MVGQQHVQVEWQSTYSEGHRSGDRLRCIPGGMGGFCYSKQRTGEPWSQQAHSMHINCLELLAATLAVKTFAKAKTAMSILLRIDNTTAVANINNLCRRDSLQGISDPHKRSMDVVPGKEYSHCSSAPTRCIEYSSRYSVQANAGQDRLKVELCNIPENQQPFWAPGHGPVCVQTVHPVPTLLQLATRSLSMHWQHMHLFRTGQP